MRAYVPIILAAAALYGCGQSGAPEGSPTEPTAQTTADTQESHSMTTRDSFADARSLTPPDIEKRPEEITQHGITRVDNYAWLRDEGWQHPVVADTPVSCCDDAFA